MKNKLYEHSLEGAFEAIKDIFQKIKQLEIVKKEEPELHPLDELIEDAFKITNDSTLEYHLKLLRYESIKWLFNKRQWTLDYTLNDYLADERKEHWIVEQ